MLIFREVARLGSLSRAATALGWTQPAVSQHMQRLEREVGLPLILRSARGITLTEAGSVLLGHADALAARLGAAEAELQELASLRKGSLRLVAFPSAAAVLVPPLLAELATSAPDLDVRLTEAEPPEARDQVLSGEVDLALTFTHHRTAATGGDLLEVVLFEDDLRAVVPADHRLAGRKRAIDLAELADERWIAGCPRCEEHLVSATAEAGFVPDVRHRTDDYVVVQRLVAEGLAVTLLPQLALTAAPNPHVRALAVRSSPRRRVSAILRAELTGNPAVAAAVEALRTGPREVL
ncbi:transcriptional regulator, LysR family [Kribbella flavida DSM 17836]|uniref:Transcriptional regulator, LysR family n=1 Tax=Kribbella flavida (strain DSM 17836 / JCM 10339 / NBRC 14399) TaxID=479435 RepID=D2PSZ4_KRIFD|nr:transcriptional regulator, LysR family [Kribbella flavida DSM 17836]